ncbi:MAG TPA: aminotransferase class V-fold PLP-dependent enzyme [Longimicrobiales bacterium]|nr:aminotransferase class V-fold PLP-dependent enzyme [Longimicrobiales bacterium]
MTPSSLDRRAFARLFAVGGSAAFFAHPALRELIANRAGDAAPGAAGDTSPWRPRPGAPVDWAEVRAAFLMPPGVAVLNAANLCPTTLHVLHSLQEDEERLDSAPFPSFRSEMHDVKERTRELLAALLHVSAEEILITRNTSEANNWVSSGLDLKPGDEVLIHADNHPSNNVAWKEKAKRFGYTVVEVPYAPHPGPEALLEAFRRALTPRTKVLAFTHLTNTSGDLFPAAEICRMAHERGVLTLVDGAQSIGFLDVDLSVMQPDFYSGSAHKWPCGPKETGVLFVNRRAQDKLWPVLYSAYTGRTPLASTHEGMGQRDEPAIRAFGRQLEWLASIGQAVIEARSRELTTALHDELVRIPGVRMFTPADPARRGAVLTFDPAGLDPAKVLAALESEGIVAASRGGSDRPGIRFSPHFYNTPEDVERAAAAIRKYVSRGV